jgi:asparagine synthase (glutamine-hydrolysing)
MCGIAGLYSLKFSFPPETIRKMTSALSHRGPDAEGYFQDERCSLGHRRLSILDLSPSANQPMYSHNQRFVCVYNGEIYNFQSLRKTLQQKGLTFHTSSDTEVLLELFAREGSSFVNALNGIFAIAIYDTLDKKLFLFRDHLGIKPLYYYHDQQTLAFASELKALKILPSFQEGNFNLQAFSHYLHVGYIPAPLTAYERVYKLPSGSYAVFSEKGLSISSYWQPAQNLTAPMAEESQALEELEYLLKEAIGLQLVADVPVGVFLSGGIDSSTVAVLAAQVSPKINTFSIGFEEDRFNEAPFARKVAQHLGTHHHELIVTASEAKSLAQSLLEVFDEPFADSSAIPTQLVSAFARKQVTVALSGDGGDELFFGYGSYNWAQRLSHPILRTFRWPVTAGLSLSKQDSHRKGRQMLHYPSGYLESHIFSQEQGFFSLAEIHFLMPSASPVGLFPPPGQGRSLSPMEIQALFDLQYYLQDDLLVKVDRSSMRYGLEARVPLLDRRLVEWALNLSPQLKYRQGIRKYLLKQVLYKYVPASYFDRPKQGFAIPLAKWLRTGLKGMADEFLDDSLVRKAGIVDPAQVGLLKKRFEAGDSLLCNRIWLLIILHQFLKIQL